ncbi:hypothetical protein [Flavobacterium aquatile]|uniref:Uncharacterized protein n=1 Tax=Flavobacterium aquatile LMG 4008 = ATCC 11947 TaxID=1453498 RepID=A0A095SQH5_9FLAO|nr:hypothetical protein [Flavobacterium aquatile]KGD66926.1 hypothetical protein LG45_15995 [Flavobacterium aquatile LMG 4008 = ATCC 11947]OXA68019.1 hypothetical protein B0A61_06005 [Flavobacterium aquatile LMG 4008 = ATCC 11947]GEC80139.1 hypothetical protein FAQ01_30090 [Flavobacterium aquatile]
MFVETAFITREFKEEQIPVLENITCLSVVNTGTTIAIINGVSIYPTQKQILIVPDGTYSKVQLTVIFLNQDRGIKRKGTTAQNKVLLIYKKLI